MSPFTPWGRPCSITHSTLCASSFFFSSRRRHTRFDCDRSSDVCSSDLGDVLIIDELYVDEVARGRGLGRRLTDTAAAYGAAIGCRSLFLEVANGNRTAQAFYAALGFTPRLRRVWERPI